MIEQGKKKPGQQSDSNTRAAWSLVVSIISSASLLKPPKLEKLFNVGDGSGRLWRAWLAGERLARTTTSTSVIAAAQKFGWFNPNDKQLAAIANLPDERIHSSGNDLPFTPPQPLQDCHNSREAAYWLIKCARFGVPLTMSRMLKLEEDNGRNWLAGLDELKKIDFESEVVREKLVAHYKILGLH